jgi:hypothetical protein
MARNRKKYPSKIGKNSPAHEIGDSKHMPPEERLLDQLQLPSQPRPGSPEVPFITSLILGSTLVSVPILRVRSTPMGLTSRLHKGLLHFRPSGKRLPSGADFVHNLDSRRAVTCIIMVFDGVLVTISLVIYGAYGPQLTCTTKCPSHPLRRSRHRHLPRISTELM